MADLTIMDTRYWETPSGVTAPICCGKKMKDDGECADGCCDDYKCLKCGKTIRMEWSD